MAFRNQNLLDEDAPISQNNFKQNTIYIHNVTVYADYGVCLDLNEVSSKFGNSLYIPSEFNCVRIDVRLNKQFKRAEFPLDKLDVQNTSSSHSLSFPPLIDSSLQFQNNLITSTKFRDNKFPTDSDSTSLDPDDPSCKTTLKVSIFANGKVVTTGARSIVAAACGLEKVARALRRRVSKEAKVCFMIVTNILSVYNTGYSIRLSSFARLCPGTIYEPDRFPAAQIKIPTKRPLYLFTATSIFGKKLPLLEPPRPSHTEEPNQGNSSPISPGNPPSSPKPIASTPINNVRADRVRNMLRSARVRAPRDGSKISLRNVAYFNKMRNSSTNDRSTASVPKSPTPEEANVDVSREKAAWISSDIYDNLNEVIGVIGDGHAKGRGINKEEVVTVNVFSTGNITFTGARSISSIKYALSLISPHLAKCK